MTNISFSNDNKIFLYNGASWVDTSLTWTNDTWHLIEIRNFNWTTARADMHKDANSYPNGDISYAASDPKWNNAVLFTNNLTTNYDIWIDCFIVRNYRATEPAWGSWGAEEAN